ncbi:hypothetical protein KDA11_05020, partial [Candidatus Saccharibacteria bacterium]|nr:hypothetical protein [Candidatus Saccharibacteria bacterium]
ILGISFIVALIVVCGIILLIIPGLIAFRRYIFAPYVLIDKKVGIKESLDISAKMTKPHSWSIYRILFVMGTIQLLGSVPFVGTIASTLLGIAYSVALAIKYLEIKKVSVTQP